jgi:hypothetical protein
MKTKRFWLALVFFIYSVFGWVAVPIIAEDQLVKALQKAANWEINIRSIIFNPYALSVEINGTTIQNTESQDILGFEKMYINFNAFRSLTGEISFDEISLTKPVINLDIDESGQSNFQKAFTTDETAEQTPPEPSSPLSLYFSLIDLSAAQINIADRSQGEEFKLTLDPLTLKLREFSTSDNDGGDYALSISMGSGQSINWSGEIGMAPFQSKGHLALTNIQPKVFWHYAKNASPYWLNDALISLSGNYDTTISDESKQVLVQQGQLKVTQLTLAEKENTPDFLKFEALDIGPITFDLAKQSLSLGDITLDTPVISALRYPDHSINIIKPLNNMRDKAVVTRANGADDNSPANEEPEGSSGFNWQISSVTIKQGSANWQDQSLTTPADLTVDNIEIDLGLLSNDLSQAFTYNIKFSTNDVTQALSGSLSPLPFKVEGDLAITHFPLSWLQNYVSESANVMLNSGSTSLNSRYQLAMNESLQGTIQSDISLDQIAIIDTLLSKPLSGFEKLALEKIDIQLNKQPSIVIDTIRLVKPYGDIFIAENGEMNLSNLSVTPADSPTEVEAKDESASSANIEAEVSDAGPYISIKNIEIDTGRFEFTDASQNPVVNTYFDQVSGYIQNLSSDLETKSKVDIKGNLETYGKLLVKGTLNPLSQKPNTDLNIQVSNIDLSTASPYSAKFAGYLIDKGKLDLNLNYKINDKNLDAQNHIFIDQFEFGESVDSPDATSLPLPLAIGIMKNLNGEIDIDLPISGNLDDPSFSITSVVLTAFTNLITKAVTSPFSVLGALVEGGDDISTVEFPAAASELDSQQVTKIMTLAKALKERPNLNLEIRGMADTMLDRTNGQTMSEDALMRLAKDRSRLMMQTIIEQGEIDETRVFVLEPQIISSEQEAPAANEPVPTIPSHFTIGVK